MCVVRCVHNKTTLKSDFGPSPVGHTSRQTSTESDKSSFPYVEANRIWTDTSPPGRHCLDQCTSKTDFRGYVTRLLPGQHYLAQTPMFNHRSLLNCHHFSSRRISGNSPIHSLCSNNSWDRVQQAMRTIT